MTRHSSSRIRRNLYRLAAVLLGLSPLLLLELGLRAGGWESPNEITDPYIGFSEIRPLFELDSESGEYRISEARLPLFQPDSFAAEKPANGFRIFCLGGSTVQGRPWSVETSFAAFLEIGLQTIAPERRWEVVNCGGVSYASYRLIPILDEILAYEPDLVVLCTGHNEFLENRTYAAVKQTPGWLNAAHERLSGSRAYQFLRSVAVEPSQTGSREILPADVEAELDFRNGLEFYHRDDRWREAIVQDFENNLEGMVARARQANVPLILLNPVSNLKDQPPFKSEHTPGASKANRTAVEQLLSGSVAQNGDAEGERKAIEKRLADNPRHAGLQFRYGSCLLELGRTGEARQALIDAKDQDVCPLRILEPMRSVVQQVARRSAIPLLDLQAFFEERTPAGIAGREWLVDHVHPNLRGHQLIATALIERLQNVSVLGEPGDDWKKEVDDRYAAHLSRLDFMYFERGQERLRGLRRWTRGEVTRER